MEWEAPLPQFRNGPILAYSLTVTDTISHSVVYSSTLPTTATVISGLQPFTPYNFTLSARTSVGFGPSDTQTEVTLEDCKLEIYACLYKLVFNKRGYDCNVLAF